VTGPVEELAALAASLPPGAVLAHVVMDDPEVYMTGWTKRLANPRRAWAKIGDEPWRSVSDLRVCQAEGWDQPDGSALLVTWRAWLNDWALFPIVTPSVTWEQAPGIDYPHGLVGRHEVMGVVG
jgi:hypothetical protein